MVLVPDHMIDCSDQPDIEALRRLSKGEYSHVWTEKKPDEPTSASPSLAVITRSDEVYTIGLDPSKSEGDIESIPGKARLRPDIGGLVVLRSSAVGPEVEEIELPD